MIEIDGSQGASGGQVVRTAMTLAACLRQEIVIRKIRANKSFGGLRPQHLTAVRALAQVTGTALDDLETGQTLLLYHPKNIVSGRHSFEVASSGSTCLVLQSILLPLAFGEGVSLLKLTGGTHNPKAPCFEYLAGTWLPLLKQIGFSFGLGMAQAGFYPRGGGTVVAQVEGDVQRDSLTPLNLTDRGEFKSLSGVIKIANHPMSVGYRMRRAAHAVMDRRGIQPVDMDIEVIEADDPASCCILELEYEHTRTTYVGVSTTGKTPEGAASEAVGAIADFMDEEKSGRAALDPFAADQMIAPLSLVPGTSRFTTSMITDHVLTTASVVERMTGRKIVIEGEKDKPGTITLA